MFSIPKDWRNYLDECLDIESGMDAWQQEFIVSLEQNAKYKFFTITIKQWTKLHEIWKAHA